MFRYIAFLLLFFATINPCQAWFNGDWAYRHRITLLNSQVNGDQLQFPVYLDLQHLPAQFFNNVKSDGADIRLVDNDDLLEIPFELVSLDTGSRIGELWFKAPSISSTSNLDFFIYYGNNNGTAYSDFEEYGTQSVWSNGYSLVSHFNENPSGPIKDSTYFNNSINSDGSMTGTNLVSLDQIETAYTFDGSDDELDINKLSSKTREIQPHRAYNFDGVNDYISLPVTAFPIGSPQVTFTTWVDSNTATDTLALFLTSSTLVNIQTAGGNQFIWYGRSRSTDPYLSAASSSGLDLSKKHHIAIAIDYTAKIVTWYIDGALDTVTTGIAFGANESQGTMLTAQLSRSGTEHLAGKLFDFRIYDKALSSNEIQSIYNFKPIQKKPVAWYKADDTHPTIAFDSSGNNNHGTKTLITPSTFHYEGNDVPYSFQNSVGYNREGYAQNGDHINIDRFSEVEGNWRGEGTTAPTVGFGNFFGESSKWVTFGAGSNTGYAGSRARTDNSFSITAGLPYSWSAKVRASRNLAPGESIYVYYTGTFTLGNRILSSSDDLTSDWLYIESENFTPGLSGTVYLTVFPNTPIASDITFYVAENQVVQNNTIDNGTYAATHGLPTGTFLPKNESRVDNKDVYNGTLSFIGKAPEYALYNGSFAGTCDGINDYIDTGIKAPFRGSLKSKFTLNSTVGSHMIIGTQSGAGRAYLGHVANNLGGGVGNDGWGTIIGATSLVTGQTYNGEITWDGTTVSLYLDGKLEYSNAQSGSPNTINNYYACAHNTGSDNFHLDGQIFDLQIYNGTNLFAHYPIAEGNGITIHDVSGNNNHGALTNAQNGDLFWLGAKQDLFHYNAQKGFTKVLKVDSQYASGITFTGGASLPVENETKIEMDFVKGSSNFPTIFAIGSLQPYRFQVRGPNLFMEYRTPGNTFPLEDMGLAIQNGQYYSLEVTINKTNGTAMIRDLLTNVIVGSTVTGISLHPSVSSSFYIGRYGNPSGSQGDSFIRRVKYTSNGTVIGEWTADSNFNDLIGVRNPSLFLNADILYLPALANGNRLADSTINGLPITNPGGAFDNRAESNIFLPKSRFDISNGDLLNIQTIFKTNDTGIETLLKKGNDDHGYELRLNNGVIEFEAMNQNGNFLVTGGTGFNDNDEHLVHVIFDPDTKIEIFIDGQKENETLISNPEKFINAYNVMIANPNTGSNFFSAELDELRFSDRVINADWINTQYNNIFNTSQFYLIDNGEAIMRNSNTMFWGGQ